MAWWLRQNSCLVWEAKREGEPNGHINDLFSHPNRTRAAIGWQCSCVSSESSRALDAGERNLWRYWPGAAWKSLTPAGDPGDILRPRAVEIRSQQVSTPA